MPMRLSPPPRSTSSRELLERAPERVARAGGVLEQQPAALRLAERVLEHLADPGQRLVARARPTVEPGWSTTPSAPIASPMRSACISDAADLARISGSFDRRG